MLPSVWVRPDDTSHASFAKTTGQSESETFTTMIASLWTTCTDQLTSVGMRDVRLVKLKNPHVTQLMARTRVSFSFDSRWLSSMVRASIFSCTTNWTSFWGDRGRNRTVYLFQLSDNHLSKICQHHSTLSIKRPWLCVDDATEVLRGWMQGRLSHDNWHSQWAKALIIRCHKRSATIKSYVGEAYH